MIANMSHYFGVEYYSADLFRIQGRDDKEIKERQMQALRPKNEQMRDTGFDVEDCRHKIPGEDGFSLWVTYPGLMMGIGNPHDGGLCGNVCAGFSLDYVTGLPYLPGSSVKGLLRSAFMYPDYIRSLLKDDSADVALLEKTLFGERPRDKRQMPPDGKIVFLDAFPQGSRDPVTYPGCNERRYRLLELEAITPHHRKELGLLDEPDPLAFLKVRPGVEFYFRFLIPQNIRFGEREIPAEKIRGLFRDIILALGVGAKKNVGFGTFTNTEPESHAVQEIREEASSQAVGQRDSQRRNDTQRQNAAPRRSNAQGQNAGQRQHSAEGICRTCGGRTGQRADGSYYPYCRSCRERYRNEHGGANNYRRR